METTHNPVITEKDMLDPVNYDGIVLTSIDVVKSPTAESPNRVTFSDLTVGSVEDDDALFIHNIREIKRGEGVGWDTTIDFEADELTLEEACAVIGSEKKALFVIHGFSSQASFHLADCRHAGHKFKKTNLIPVIWPSEGKCGLFDYRNDKKLSKGAGKALQSMKGPIQKLGSASIVCHSMGNRVFRNFSDPDINFDNIFMVAADVDGDLFHEGYINGGMFGQNAEWRKHGSNIKGMLSNKDTGKIHVIYNPDDSRMFQSKFMNLGVRLGGAGVNLKPAWFGKTVHEDIKDSIVNVNAQEANMLYPEDPGKTDHNYHFHDNTIKYYEEHA